MLYTLNSELTLQDVQGHICCTR